MDHEITLPDPPDGSPAGPNLENDPAFGEMERAAKGTPESQFGNTVEAAVPPDWKEAASLANALLARSRDLRPMVQLAIAGLNGSGLPAYAAGVALVRRHLETMWEHVHPLLDPEDDNDTMQRANVVRVLGSPGQVLRPLRDLPLATTVRTGPVAWRDIAVLNGSIEAEPGRPRKSEGEVRAAFAGTDAGKLAELRAAVAGLPADLAAIVAVFTPRMSADDSVDFDVLVKLLRDIEKELVRYEAEPADAEPEVAGAAADDDRAPAAATRATKAYASVKAITALATREEALYALELAATYYRTNEPASPLPLLIDRAIRLAPMPFLDILRDLAPDGLSQAQIVTGATND